MTEKEVIQISEVTEFDLSEYIEAKCNLALMCLFRVRERDASFVPDFESIQRAGIDKSEPVNWGSVLKASVTKNESGFIISIYEAMPQNCPTLCSYIENFVKKLGWENIEVLTEW